MGGYTIFTVGAPGDTLNNATRIMSVTAVLWVSSRGEAETARKNQNKAYQSIPDTVKKDFLEVSGSYSDVPVKSYEAAIKWLVYQCLIV